MNIGEVILFVHIFYHEKCTRRLQQYEIRFHQIVEEHQNRQLQQKQLFKEKNRTSKITAEIQIKSQTEYNITHNRKVEQLPHLVLGILSLTEDPVFVHVFIPFVHLFSIFIGISMMCYI
jgi:hypothetical protein